MKREPVGMEFSDTLAVLERIAPLELAEEWDNVGCLLAPVRARSIRRILLTIDASPAVVDEALRKRAELVVAYHPPIFQPLNRLHPGDPLQARLLKLIEGRVALYSPHTALDAVAGGVNDWLVAGIRARDAADSSILGDGPGRLVEFRKGLDAEELVRRIQKWLGVSYLRVARPQGRGRRIRRVAVCAGAGYGALAETAADVYVTGEMKHHDILAASARGAWVVLSEHTHTERGYLPTLKQALEREMAGCGVEVFLSRTDRDPVELIQ